jgi:hypothetical protein
VLLLLISLQENYTTVRLREAIELMAQIDAADRDLQYEDLAKTSVSSGDPRFPPWLIGVVPMLLVHAPSMARRAGGSKPSAGGRIVPDFSEATPVRPPEEPEGEHPSDPHAGRQTGQSAGPGHHQEREDE